MNSLVMLSLSKGGTSRTTKRVYLSLLLCAIGDSIFLKLTNLQNLCVHNSHLFRILDKSTKEEKETNFHCLVQHMYQLNFKRGGVIISLNGNLSSLPQIL